MTSVAAYAATSSYEEEGAVYLYLGSAEGLKSADSWSYTGGQAFAHFGWSLAGGGDLNQDGYSDFAIGAPDYDYDSEDDGRVYVWYGSASGPSSGADWTRASMVLWSR